MDSNRPTSPENTLLFRTVTALGAELRRQRANVALPAEVDLIDLAYAAIAVSQQSKAVTEVLFCPVG